MIIEGKNAVIEALNSEENITVEKITVNQNMRPADLNQIYALARAKNVPVTKLAANKFPQSSSNQGVIAYCTTFKYSTVADILATAKDKNQHNFIVILDGIADPHNFGSIIRVCECLGVHGIIIGKNRACPVNQTVIKTSAGAASYMKIAKVTNINHEIEALKKQDIWVYACELGGQPLSTTDLKGNIAIVIGSEGNGVSDLTKKLCDGIITIEMHGNINSLNASVAAGIALYQTSLQRN